MQVPGPAQQCLPAASDPANPLGLAPPKKQVSSQVANATIGHKSFLSRRSLMQSSTTDAEADKSLQAMDGKYLSEDTGKSATLHAKFARFVRGDVFELVICLAIVFNTLIMAVDAQYVGDV